MDNITYRDVAPSDYDDVWRIVSDYNVARQLGSWAFPPQPAFVAGRCRPYMGDGNVWAVAVNGTFSGTVAMTGHELGYTLDPRVHGRGIGTRVAQYAVSYAFDTLGRDHVDAGVWYDNPASQAILRKLGFVHWQSRYERATARKRPVLCQFHRLTRAKWHEGAVPG